MSWWVITKLIHFIGSASLSVLATTNSEDHLFMSWAYNQPRKQPIYITVRGVEKFCGWLYIWDTPNIVEQQETGDTLTHTFILPHLLPHSTLWYYLHAPGGPYGLEIQGPLTRVSLAVTEDISVRAWSPIDQTIPINTWTPLNFITSLWDTDTMHDPVLAPTKITINSPGKYQISGNLQYVDTTGQVILLRIMLNDTTPIAQIQMLSFDGAPVTLTSICISTLYILEVGDYLTLETYHDGPLANYDIQSVSLYSPAFMAILIA